MVSGWPFEAENLSTKVFHFQSKGGGEGDCVYWSSSWVTMLLLTVPS